MLYKCVVFAGFFVITRKCMYIIKQLYIAYNIFKLFILNGDCLSENISVWLRSHFNITTKQFTVFLAIALQFIDVLLLEYCI